MIDDALREAFASHEHLVPAASDVRPAIAERVLRRRARRRTAWSAGAAFAVVLLALVPAAVSNWPRSEVLLGGEPDPLAGTAPGRPMNFLLLGLDRRPGEPDTAGRADAIVLVHVDEAHRKAAQISIPRDLSLDVPDRGKHWAGNIYGLGGYELTARTVEHLTGVTIDGGVVVDFAGVERVTEAVGGVELCVESRTVSIHIGYDAKGRVQRPFHPDGRPVQGVKPVVYEPGCHHFEAWQALDYVRQRKSLPDGLADRDRHVRQFLVALANELTDPVKLTKALPVAGSALELHLGSASSVTELALQLRSVDTADLPGVRVPVWPTRDGSGTVLQPASAGLFAALRDDTLAAWIRAHP